MNPAPMIIATVRRHPWTHGLFVALIAIATAIGVAITAQEAALRSGSARAADKFDLIVAAPGSQTDVVMTAIYLRPGVVPLLEPAKTVEALNDPRAAIAAPLGFGDSVGGSPIVGTVATFADYLSGGLADGRLFKIETEAVVGAAVELRLGTMFRPAHGVADGGGEDAHEHPVDITVVGRMKPTGTPWDNAVLIPIELVWRLHGLLTGHAPWSAQIGPPFGPGQTPGVPAIVLRPASINAAYGLRNVYRTSTSMAFFPAEALVKLYNTLGDIRDVMSWMALATQALVLLAMLAGVAAMLAMRRRQFATLRALGAPRLYVFLCVWGQVAVVALAGAFLGLALGAIVAIFVSHEFTRETGVVLTATIGLDEWELAVGMIVFGLVAATVPAFLLYRQPVVEALRDGG